MVKAAQDKLNAEGGAEPSGEGQELNEIEGEEEEPQDDDEEP